MIGIIPNIDTPVALIILMKILIVNENKKNNITHPDILHVPLLDTNSQNIRAFPIVPIWMQCH